MNLDVLRIVPLVSRRNVRHPFKTKCSPLEFLVLLLRLVMHHGILALSILHTLLVTTRILILAPNF
jgi:hypothetical protein